MQFEIEIIDVSPVQSISNGRGGTYRTVEVAYKRDGKVEGKKLVDFNRPEVFEAAIKLKRGERAVVATEKETGKDGKGYWQWTGVGAPGTEAPQVGAPAQTDTASPPQAKPESVYDGKGKAGYTPGGASSRGAVSFDDARQHYIVRQSSLTAAINILTFNTPGKAKVDPKEVVEMAEKLHDYVFSGKNPFVTGVEALKQLEDDIPF